MTTDLWTVNPDGRLQLHLHPGQARAWRSTRRFVTVCAGSQGGKTAFGPPWLYREIQQRGPGDYLVAAPTFPLLSLKLLPEFKRFFEDKGRFGTYTGSPVKVFRFSREGARRTFGETTDTPTQVFFGHAQDPDSLESATAKGAWLDEAGQKKFRHGSWQAILRRLSIHQGRVLTTTTPYSAFGWFKTELHDRAKAGDPDYDWIRFESRMNPSFPAEEWERARRTLPAWKFDLMYRGILTRPAGMIYDCFTDEHITPAFPIPSDWRRWMGVDFGGVNTAAVYLAEEPGTGRFFAYRDYTAPDRTAGQHARAMLEGEPGIPTAYGGAGSEGQWRKEFRAGGLPIKKPVVPDVEVGIDRVYGLINSGNLIVLDSCTRLINDLTTYARKLDDDDQPTDEIEDKNAYHFADALRYIGSRLNGGIGRASVTDVRRASGL
jgi:hypothetical protein